MVQSNEHSDRLFSLVAAGEPAEFRTTYLARPAAPAEVRGQGTTVPLLGTRVMVENPSGLLVPQRTIGQRMAASAVKYMTANELVGRRLNPAELDELIHGHAREDILDACAILIARLYESDPVARETQVQLASSLVGPARKIAHALMAAGDWIFLAPQAVLNVAKLALLGVPRNTRDPATALNDVMLASLGLASFLGADRDDESAPLWWGTVPEPIATDTLCNQLFNRTLLLGSVLARWHRMRELAESAFPEAARTYEDVFLEATGSTSEVLFDVGFTALLKLRQDKSVAIEPDFLRHLKHQPEHIDAAISLLTQDVDLLSEAVAEEASRVGFNWSFNALRRFPMYRRSDGALVVLNPAFLVERICATAYFWEVRNELTRRKALPGEVGAIGKRLAGGFENFVGHVAEEYIVERLATSELTGSPLTKRLWRESELQALWPDQPCCDVLIDSGSSWVAIEVVSRRMSEEAAEAGSLTALDKDLRYIVDEKARQLDATIKRLIAGGALPGSPGRQGDGRCYHPVIVAASGFPWNPIVAAAVHGRLVEQDRLQHPAIRPLTVITTEDVEHVEGFIERGLGTLSGILDDRSALGETDGPIDWYLHHRGGLIRPRSLNGSLRAAFDHVATAQGIDPSDLDKFVDGETSE